jgi:hypothetical protein
MKNILIGMTLLMASQAGFAMDHNSLFFFKELDAKMQQMDAEFEALKTLNIGVNTNNANQQTQVQPVEVNSPEKRFKCQNTGCTKAYAGESGLYYHKSRCEFKNQ